MDIASILSHLNTPVLNDAVPLFFIYICGFVLTLVLLKFLIWFPVYLNWAKKLKRINLEANVLDDESFESFELKTKKSRRIRKIILIIRDFASESVDVSVNDIHVLVSETVRKPERTILTYASFFLFAGLVTTIYGIYTSLAVTFGSGVELDEKIISNLLNGFSLAFYSTLIGVIFFVLTKLLQMAFANWGREPFEYNIKLYAKNVLIPRIAIPSVEKNLGKLVRTLSISSSKMEKASDSLIEVSKTAQRDTQEISKTIEHFHEIIETIEKRESALITAYERISENLFSLKGAMKEVILPLEQLRTDMNQRDYQIKPQLELIAQIYNYQTDVDKDLKKSLKTIEKSHQRLGSFFNKDFKNDLDKAIDRMLADHDSKIDKIYKSVDFLEKSDAKTYSEFQKTFNKGIGSLTVNTNKFEAKLKQDFKIISDVLESMKVDSDLINSYLNINETALDNSILSVDKLTKKHEKISESLDKKIQTIEKNITDLSDKGESGADSNSIKSDISKLSKSTSLLSADIEKFADLRREIDNMIKKIEKLKNNKGIIASFFKAGRS